MGMFDREPNLTAQEFAKDGNSFQLLDGEYVGRVESPQYGPNDKGRALVRTERDNAASDRWYSVFGVLADQIRRMEDDDLPALVRIEKDGDANTFVRAE